MMANDDDLRHVLRAPSVVSPLLLYPVLSLSRRLHITLAEATDRPNILQPPSNIPPWPAAEQSGLGLAVRRRKRQKRYHPSKQLRTYRAADGSAVLQKFGVQASARRPPIAAIQRQSVQRITAGQLAAARAE